MVSEPCPSDGPISKEDIHGTSPHPSFLTWWGETDTALPYE